jgi:hypothetical protein
MWNDDRQLALAMVAVISRQPLLLRARGIRATILNIVIK